jgi:phospholipid/cholesterol/gamma-HCH transport system substrate-binding protein
MTRLWRGRGRELVALAALVAIGSTMAVYVLDRQRLRWPFEDTRRLTAVFSSAQALRPGQGHSVTVAGVVVGEVVEVRLEEGRAVVEMDLDNPELGPVYRNARLLVRPRTMLNDMSIELDPGRPDASLPGRGELKEGERLGPSATVPNVNPDELLASLDADTRRYLTIALNAAGRGLRGRGRDLREVLRATRPTVRDMARLGGVLRARRAQLRRLVHNMRLLWRATASRERPLAQMVDTSAVVFGAIGRRERHLSRAVARMPGALAATRDALTTVGRFADEARPAVEALQPAVRRLPHALRSARPLSAEGAKLLRTQLRPLVREALPVVRPLAPTLAALQPAVGDVDRVAGVLNRLVNELAYNPPGREEGYLFWLAWFAHNASSIVSIEDAHGAAWRGLSMMGCSSFAETPVGAALAAAQALGACPSASGPDRRRGREGR